MLPATGALKQNPNAQTQAPARDVRKTPVRKTKKRGACSMDFGGWKEEEDQLLTHRRAPPLRLLSPYHAVALKRRLRRLVGTPLCIAKAVEPVLFDVWHVERLTFGKWTRGEVTLLSMCSRQEISEEINLGVIANLPGMDVHICIILGTQNTARLHGTA